MAFRSEGAIRENQESGLVHLLVTTAANVSDISLTPALLHGQEEAVWTDTGYVATWPYKMARVTPRERRN